MPFDSYTALTEKLADYLERGDMAPFLPDFVRLAELRLDRRLNLADNETAITLSLAAGATPLPEDYRAWRSVTTATGSGVALDYVTPDAFYGRWRGCWRSTTGETRTYVAGWRSSDFTVVGSVPLSDLDVPLDTWSFGADNPVMLVGPATTGDIRLIYRQGIPPLGADRPTNWLLRRYPDLYLYASLMEAEPFLKNDARILTWRGLLEEALKDVTALDREARWGRGRFRLSGPCP